MKTIIVKKSDYKGLSKKDYKKIISKKLRNKIERFPNFNKTIYAVDGLTTLYKGGCFN